MRKAEARRPWGHVLGITSWLVLGGVVPVLLIDSQVGDAPARLVVVQTLLVVYSAARLCQIVGAGEPRLFTGVFWLFVYVALGVAPLAQFTTDSYPLTVKDADLLLPAVVVILVGCIAFDVGQQVAARRRLRTSPDRGLSGEPVTLPRLRGFSVFAVLASAYYVREAGGVEGFFRNRQEFSETTAASGLISETSQGTSALVTSFGTAPALIALLCWTVTLIGASPQERVRVVPWWIAFVAINVVVNNPISNTRFWALTVFGALVLTLPGLSAARFRAILLVGVAAAIFVFPYADYYRYDEAGRKTVEARSVWEPLTVKDYDQLVMTADGMWWIDRRGGHTWGRQALGPIFFWVPRAVWPQKPKDTGVEIGLAMDAIQPNLSSPLWLEAWVDFGLVGAAALLALWGFAARRADDLFLDVRGLFGGAVLTRISVLLPVIACYQLIVLRGPLLQATGRLVVILVLVWALTVKLEHLLPAAVRIRRRRMAT